MDLDELVQNIFSKKPQTLNSIQLELEDQDVKGLFEFFLMMFTNGSKLLYGNYKGHVDLSKWTIDELKVMKQYFASFGISLVVDIYNKIEQYNINFNNMNYRNIIITEQTLLNTLKLPLMCNDKIYVISFEFI